METSTPRVGCAPEGMGERDHGHQFLLAPRPESLSASWRSPVRDDLDLTSMIGRLVTIPSAPQRLFMGMVP